MNLQELVDRLEKIKIKNPNSHLKGDWLEDDYLVQYFLDC